MSYIFDQGSQGPRVLKNLGGTGLVRESVDLAAHKIDGALVLVVQRLVGNGNGESMATMFVVPSVITQFSYVKRLVDEETKSRMRQRLSWNTSMFETESGVEGSLFICLGVNQWRGNTSFVEVPLHFFANHLLDVLFIQFFYVGEWFGFVGMPIALVGTQSPFLQDLSFLGGGVYHVLVDAFSDPFLQGGFKQDILRFAFHHLTVEEGEELFPFQPATFVSPGVFVGPLEEIALALGTFEEEAPWVSF